jgi:hypothetical protein
MRLYRADRSDISYIDVPLAWSIGGRIICRENQMYL